MTYMMTWYTGTEALTVSLQDLTPDGLCDAAANADMPHELFTDTFIYRTLYALTYQLLQGGGDAAVDLGEYGNLLVVVGV